MKLSLIGNYNSLCEGKIGNFVKKEFKTDLSTLFTGKKTEEYKINLLDQWWNAYKNQEK